MKTIALIAAALSFLSATNAQQWKPDARVVGSVSGQFFVSATAPTVSAHSMQLATQTNLVVLQPALVAVSCERIKQLLLHDLAMPDNWQGKIFIALRPARDTNDLITIVPERMGGDWGCGVEIPDAVDRDHFVEAVVRACLLEIANRKAMDQSAEIPEWLVLGFARQMLSSSEDRLILPPPDAMENGMNVKRIRVELTDNPAVTGPNMRKLNPLAEAMTTFRTNTPLTFDELSWPSDEQLSEKGAGVYTSSAQLFVAELLRMEHGPEYMRATLTQLPNYLNWQLAFLAGYKTVFQEPLDIEKWWALEQVDFTGRDLQHLWTPEESWKQLDVLFHFPIDVQIGDAPPMRTEITFQTIIRGWSRARQLELLKKKLWELDMARLRVAPDFIPLVDGYREALQDYYKKRSASTKILPQSGPVTDKPIEEAVQQLDALDVERAKKQPQPEMPMASADGKFSPINP